MIEDWDPRTVVNYNIEDAIYYIEANGYSYVITIDSGQIMNIVNDHRIDRVQLIVDNDIVTSAVKG